MTATSPPAQPITVVDPNKIIEKMMAPETLEALRQAFPDVPPANLENARQQTVECAIVTMRLLTEGNFQWGLAALVLAADLLKQNTTSTQETFAKALLEAAQK